MEADGDEGRDGGERTEADRKTLADVAYTENQGAYDREAVDALVGHEAHGLGERLVGADGDNAATLDHVRDRTLSHIRTEPQIDENDRAGARRGRGFLRLPFVNGTPLEFAPEQAARTLPCSGSPYASCVL